jgi:hypothetical protein
LPNNLDNYLSTHPALLSELPSNDTVCRFALKLPDAPKGRQLGSVVLEIPEGFPESATARIRLPLDCVLKVPHVESDGKLCMGDGDPGRLSGASPVERIQQLIDTFFEQFFKPWCAGHLDGDFADEAQNYWLIHCNRSSSQQDAVTRIYTVNSRPNHAQIYYAKYLVAQRVVVIGDSELSSRFVSVMAQGKQIRQVIVADIPISVPFTPEAWPRDQKSLKCLLRIRLGQEGARNFLSKGGHRNSLLHRVVLLRAPTCSFGFLLPNGPANIVKNGGKARAHPTIKLLPLLVERLDPNWTCGRDQHPEINLRQQKHVLVIGAGALGSSVIEQLAKSGVGYITIVDGERLSSANIGRHVLGADAIGRSKSSMLASQLSLRWPSCIFKAEPTSIESWLSKNNLSDIDVLIDLTGEPEVRLSIDIARKIYPCPLLIGWMEPYVAAAHACLLPKNHAWLLSSVDGLESLQAISWPNDVIQREPACSSEFQSYTSASATHAIGLVTEAALDLLDEKIEEPVVRHWVRGQKFLDAHHSGLKLRDWAIKASPFDGVSMELPYA